MNLGSLWRYVRHSGREFGRDNCPQFAAAISYYVLFSIVPLTFLLVSVFGLVIRSEHLRTEVVQEVVGTIGLEPGDVLVSLDEERLRDRGLGPQDLIALRTAIARLTSEERQDLAERLRRDGRIELEGRVLAAREVVLRYQNTISDTLNDVASASARLTVFSLLFSAWSGSAMFGAIRKALNVIWKVEFQRAYLQQKLLDLLMVVAFGGLLLASVLATGAIRAFREASDGFLGPLSENTGVIWGALAYILPALVTFFVFALVYRFVPATKVRFRDVWFGALIATLLFEVLKNGFAFYVENFRANDLLYGSLGGILLFLTSVFFGSAILLFGAELSYAMPGMGVGAFDSVHDPSKPKVGLVGQVRKEVAGFFRSLVWATPRDGDAEARTRPAPRRR